MDAVSRGQTGHADYELDSNSILLAINKLVDGLACAWVTGFHETREFHPRSLSWYPKRVANGAADEFGDRNPQHTRLLPGMSVVALIEPDLGANHAITAFL